MPRLKRFLSEVRQGVVPQTLWQYDDVGHTQEAKRELLKYVPFQETENVLNSVKPTRLIRRMLQIATDPAGDNIVLDFFSGSAATGHAVLTQNAEDGGNRRFILVQFPEPLPKPEQGLRTIFDMGTARIRNVINELGEEAKGTLEFEKQPSACPLGFRVMRLSDSNFKIWEGDKALRDAEGLAEQLKLYADHVLEGRSQQDILYELILKAGLPLAAKIEEKAVDGKTVYSVADGLLLICLEDEVTAELLRQMMDLKPQQIICLDRAFRGNDQLKTNTVLEIKQREITFRTV